MSDEKICKEVQDEIDKIEKGCGVSVGKLYHCKKYRLCLECGTKVRGILLGAELQLKADMKIMKKLIKQIPFPNEEEQKKMNIKIEKAFEVKKHETKKTM